MKFAPHTTGLWASQGVECVRKDPSRRIKKYILTLIRSRMGTNYFHYINFRFFLFLPVRFVIIPFLRILFICISVGKVSFYYLHLYAVVVFSSTLDSFFFLGEFARNNSNKVSIMFDISYVSNAAAGDFEFMLKFSVVALFIDLFSQALR